MMVKLTSLGELIETAIGAENAARKVYLGFTHKFVSRPDVSDFWQTMADDEGDHARILSQMRECVSAEELSAPIDARLAEMARHLKMLDIRKLVNSVDNLDDAYQTAYDLESSEVNAIFNFLTIRFLSTDESYEIITATIDHHLLRLADFTRTFGDAEHCKHIAAIA
ncbi:MAG: ferritin family protein [Planctomycetota bacterium]|jgi:rubrerythrin